MKCLSLKQPYADLILAGRKTIENRHWNTKYRGELWIHASSSVMKEACQRLGIDEKTLVTGAILGKVQLVDSIKYSSLEQFRFLQGKHFAPDTYYEEGKTYGFVVTSPQRLEQPVSHKGRLGFFDAKVKSLSTPVAKPA